MARSSGLVHVAVAVFAVGLVALAAVFVLYVSGHRELPLWLNTSAGVLVPLGLASALVGLVREARSGCPVTSADRPASPGRPSGRA